MTTDIFKIYQRLTKSLIGFPGFRFFDNISGKSKNNQIDTSVFVNEKFSVIVTYFENKEKNNFGINFDEISLSNRYACRNMIINDKIFDELSFHLFNVFNKNGVDLSHQNIKEWEKSFLQTEFKNNDDCFLLFSLFCEKVEQLRKKRNDDFLQRIFEFMKFEKYITDFSVHITVENEKISIDPKNLSQIFDRLRNETKYALSFNFENLINIDLIKNNDFVYIYSNDEEINVENIMQNKELNQTLCNFNTLNILENIMYNIVTINQIKKEPETDLTIKI